VLSQDFRCIDFDMRGYGQSEQPIQPYTMEVWADRGGRANSDRPISGKSA
jgi:pimeloyl-ACP methyl ester carboxylesterase